jgi:LPXTG-motif cell wall-anchored protein
VVFQPLVTGEEGAPTPLGRRVQPSLFLAIGAVALVLAGGLLVFIRRQF